MKTLTDLGKTLRLAQRRLPIVRQRAEELLAQEGGQLLLARALRALGRFPTQGEAATWLGRRTAPLFALNEELRQANARLNSQLSHELLHAFWTTERQALLKDLPKATARVNAMLTEPMDTPWKHEHDHERYTKDLIYSLDPDGVHGLDKAWRVLNERRSARFPRQQVDLCRELVLAAKLDRLDEAALLEEITIAPKELRLYGDQEFFRNDTAARHQMLIMLGLESGGEQRESKRLIVSIPSNTDPLGTFTSEEAFRQLVKHPDARLETPFEFAARTERLPRLARNLTSTDELDDVTVLIDDTLDSGLLRQAGHDNPFIREAMFRFFEAIGLDPRTEAAFVTDGREVGSRRYSGTWHLYPVPDRGYVLALGMDQFGAGRLDACKGSLDTVKASLAHHRMVYYVPGRSDADNRRLNRELDPAPDRNPNFFGEYAALFDPAKITEQYALREELLAKDVKP